MYALEYHNIEVINFNYVIIRFEKSKEATAFKERFEKHIKAYNRELSTSIEITRFPENKRDQPIIRIKGLGDLASTNFDQFTGVLTLTQQFLHHQDTPSSGGVVTGADHLRQNAVSHGDMSNPDDWLVAYFGGKSHIVKRRELIEAMAAQFTEIEAEEYIGRWWEDNKEKYGQYDADLNAYLLIE